MPWKTMTRLEAVSDREPAQEFGRAGRQTQRRPCDERQPVLKELHRRRRADEVTGTALGGVLDRLFEVLTYPLDPRPEPVDDAIARAGLEHDIDPVAAIDEDVFPVSRQPETQLPHVRRDAGLGPDAVVAVR